MWDLSCVYPTYTSVKFLLVIYTESVVVSCFVCVCVWCVMNTEIVLGCMCEVCYEHRNVVVFVCVFEGGGLLSSSLPTHRLDCNARVVIPLQLSYFFLLSSPFICHSHMWR